MIYYEAIMWRYSLGDMNYLLICPVRELMGFTGIAYRSMGGGLQTRA